MATLLDLEKTVAGLLKTVAGLSTRLGEAEELVWRTAAREQRYLEMVLREGGPSGAAQQVRLEDAADVPLTDSQLIKVREKHAEIKTAEEQKRTEKGDGR